MHRSLTVLNHIYKEFEKQGWVFLWIPAKLWASFVDWLQLRPHKVKNMVKNLTSSQWWRYVKSWQVLCLATEKIGPGAGTCLWYCNERHNFRSFSSNFVINI